MEKMLWLFASKIVLPICMSTSMNDWQARNLSEITWFNAANSQDLLAKALASHVDILEADVFIGTHVITEKARDNNIPVMGEPSDSSSDLSLEQFLTAITQHNNDYPKNRKAVQLDFKSIEALTASVEILKNDWPVYKEFPVLINAEILEGPGENHTYTPINAQQFIQTVSQLQNAILSIGWTTNWTPNTTEYYSQDETLTMKEIIAKNIFYLQYHPITFSVRAPFAGHFLSKESFARMKGFSNNGTTAEIGIWSHEDDQVDVKGLQQFIGVFGARKIFLNVPKELRNQIDLSKSGANPLFQLDNFNSAALIAAIIFVNHFF